MRCHVMLIAVACVKLTSYDAEQTSVAAASVVCAENATAKRRATDAALARSWAPGACPVKRGPGGARRPYVLSMRINGYEQLRRPAGPRGLADPLAVFDGLTGKSTMMQGTDGKVPKGARYAYLDTHQMSWNQCVVPLLVGRDATGAFVVRAVHAAGDVRAVPVPDFLANLPDGFAPARLVLLYAGEDDGYAEARNAEWLAEAAEALGLPPRPPPRRGQDPRAVGGRAELLEAPGGQGRLCVDLAALERAAEGSEAQWRAFVESGFGNWPKQKKKKRGRGLFCSLFSCTKRK